MLLPPLIPGRLVRRYQRFLADVELDDGSVRTVHCPNSGSMKGCLGAGWPVLLSTSGNPKRKHRHTWELVHNGTCWIGINTSRTNSVVEEGLRSGSIPELASFDELHREVRLGDRSRIDFAVIRGGHRTWVEVKSVTMVDHDGRFAFPDAVTSRGAKHLRELTGAVARGDRAVMLFLIQRADGDGFTVADDIDPGYGETLRRAVDAGVEVLAHRAEVSPEEIRVVERVPVEL
ncbi:MAG: DNA/RNA nuclease SfsA [Holophagae bacterium]|jgi:sugar fermentation stimulation protein A